MNLIQKWIMIQKKKDYDPTMDYDPKMDFDPTIKFHPKINMTINILARKLQRLKIIATNVILTQKFKWDIFGNFLTVCGGELMLKNASDEDDLIFVLFLYRS